MDIVSIIVTTTLRTLAGGEPQEIETPPEKPPEKPPVIISQPKPKQQEPFLNCSFTKENVYKCTK